MHCKKKLILFGWDFSRKGGIEEVSRQVANLLISSNLFDVKILKYPKSNKLDFLINIWLRFILKENEIYFFMHPFIYQKTHTLISSKKNVTTIVWAHGIEVWGEFGRRNNPSLASVNKILASSHYTRERVLENFPSANVSVARLAVQHSLCSKIQTTKEPFEILTVGRLAANEKYKGHDLVIKALRILKVKGITIKYHIVGSGSDSDRLQRLAQNLGLSSQVVFHGYLIDHKLQLIYARSSVFVMPSHVIRRPFDIWSGEGLGLVYLEASLNNLPVIACEEGGQRDCVIHGETGFLVQPHPEMIADRIEWFYLNRAECIRMGAKGRKFVSENFTTELFKNDVLESVAAAKKHSN